MVPFNGAWSRIQQLTGLSTQAELADALGINPASVSGAKKRGFFPLEWMLKIALDYQVSMDALIGISEHGQMVGVSAFQAKTAAILSGKPSREENELLYEYEHSPIDDRTLETVVSPHSKDQLLQAIGFSTETMAIVRAHCDSMEPTIRKGDLMVVDRSCTAIETNGIYVFQAKQNLIIKRVELLLNGFLRFFSDNPAYPSERVHPEQLSAEDIFGLVVWKGGRI
ncbi:CI repressor [Desulfurispirillum indicum S5]|uniref:CI repressor n=1 Tax=Desulfurispirillum indicum (strain ATCC BAA-1389 / DSM 22839 / S5) TaxID=653733 RepID=E6W293_DESIS|nr:LexA family transcriptional regulator [Desulfurispirillum indicum]ADU65551.1 CI repressor [Desulfurispirillum indicum S5]